MNKQARTREEVEAEVAATNATIRKNKLTFFPCMWCDGDGHNETGKCGQCNGTGQTIIVGSNKKGKTNHV